MTGPPSHKLKVKELEFLVFLLWVMCSAHIKSILPLPPPPFLLPSHFSFEVSPSALDLLASSLWPTDERREECQRPAQLF